MRIVLAALLMTTGATAAPAPVRFASDIAPILKTHCATCHMTGQEAGNMALYPAAAYSNLVGVKATAAGLVRVVPGKPDDSYLLMKLEGTHLDRGGKGVRMPLGGEPLPSDQIAKIKAWITAGARND